MKCPYCDHNLSLKDTRQGLYGRCVFCRFSGYIPTGRSEQPSNKIEEPSNRVEKESNKDNIRIGTFQ